jgi:hypothetical protein
MSGDVKDLPIAILVAVDHQGIVALGITALALIHIGLEVIEAIWIILEGFGSFFSVSAIFYILQRGTFSPTLAVVNSHA